MPKRKCNDWIEAYMDYTSNLESPDAFHFWTAVSTIAGSLRKRVYIPQRHFKWYPNFFIVFVGPPGIVKKSTTMDVGKNLLKELNYIHFGPDIVTWQSFITRLAESVDDIIEEDSGDVMTRTQKTSCAMTIYSSELGNFLDPANKELINALTDLWDGKEDIFEKGTKTQGDDKIENPFVNMIGCTTPAWMQDNFKGQFVGWGFSSRTILIYRDRKRKRVAYPGLTATTAKEQKLKEGLIEDLKTISYLRGAYTMSPGAIALGEEWYQKHCDREERLNAEPSSDPYLAHFLARAQGHAHKLAIVIAASRRDELVITEQDLSDAFDHVKEIEVEMDKLFQRRVTIPQNGTATALITILSKYGRMPEVDLYRGMAKTGASYHYITDAISLLLKADLIARICEEGTFYFEMKAPAIGE